MLYITSYKRPLSTKRKRSSPQYINFNYVSGQQSANSGYSFLADWLPFHLSETLFDFVSCPPEAAAVASKRTRKIRNA